MKLLSLNFQRNGIGGDPFFQATAQDLSDNKGKFLITFETDESKDDEIISSSCRVSLLEGDHKHPEYSCWRGDTIAGELQILLTELREKHNVKSLFDLKIYFQNKATKTNFKIHYKDETNISKN